MHRKIVIIGAGASGIAAATKLIEHGYKSVVLLEAEKRIGGRINTVPFGESVIDLGAQWCHGEEGNVVFQLAKDRNLFESDTLRFLSMLAIESDGTVLPQSLNLGMMQLYMSISQSDDFTAQSGSVGDGFIECFSKALESPEFSDVTAELRQEYLQHFEAREKAFNACNSWLDLSRKKYKEFHDCEGDFTLNWKNKGYATLFDLLTKKIENNGNYIRLEDHVHQGKEVVKITYNAAQPAEAQVHPIRIQCSDGSVYAADHVICSVSLGVLKERHRNLFDPPLPRNKIDTIEGLGFGVVGKIFLEFEKPFWPDDWSGCTLLWKSDDVKKIREQPGSEWLEHISGIFTINQQKNLLLLWINGPGAGIMERLPVSQVQSGALFLLRKFLKDWDIPDPIRLKRSEWLSNPHFRGSYTYYSVGGDSLDLNIETLAEPINNASGKPIVLFCGEATNKHHFKSVHGAVESGWREAERLINSV